MKMGVNNFTIEKYVLCRYILCNLRERKFIAKTNQPTHSNEWLFNNEFVNDCKWDVQASPSVRQF